MLHKNLNLRKNYNEYLTSLKGNNLTITSKVVSQKEIEQMQSNDYDLTTFEIYIYVKVSEHINKLGPEKINLQEGIKLTKNKYKNISEQDGRYQS